MKASFILFVLAACLLSGCKITADQPGERTHGWPFFESAYSADGTKTDRFAGPFVENTYRADGFTRNSVKPFYSYTVDPANYEKDLLLFYPIGRMRKRERPGWPGRSETQIHAFPFFWWNDVSYSPGHRELDYFFFPLVMGGESTIDGDHFAVLPFGGNLKGIFGKDEIRFVMFPLYLELHNRGRTTYYLPFPIVKWGYGPGYRTYGVMPLFSRTEVWREVDDNVTGGTKNIPVADRWTILWPIFRYDREGLDKKYPQESLMVYPLFGYKKSAVTTNISALFMFNWPLFSYSRGELNNSTIVDAFWPIFRYGKGDNFRHYRLWPLYDYYNRDFGMGNSSTVMSVLWPFFWYYEDVFSDYTEQRIQVFPLFYALFREYLPEPDGTTRTKDLVRVWPLAKYEKEIDGTTTFEMLSIFPFDDEEFDETWGGLFKFFTVKSGPEETKVQALFRLFSYEEDPYEIDVSLAPLFHWHVKKQPRDQLPDVNGPMPGDVEDFDILYGLLGYHHGPEDRYTRLFWGVKIRE